MQRVRHAVAGAEPPGPHLQHALVISIPGTVIVFFAPGVGVVLPFELRPCVPKAGALGVFDRKFALDNFAIIAAGDFAPGDTGIPLPFDPFSDLVARRARSGLG